MDKQKTFLEPTWKREDTVVIDGKQGTIKLFHKLHGKVQVEFNDAVEGGTYKRWYPIEELPPYPGDEDESPPSEATDDLPEINEDDNGVSPDAETAPVGNMDGETEPIATDLVDVTPPEEKADDGEKEPVADPDVTADDEPEAEEEIDFAAGHKRQLKSGTTLTVLERSRKEHYMVRVHHAAGGTIDKEKHWKEIRDWGEPVTEPEKTPADEIIAAVQKKLGEQETATDAEPDADSTTVEQPEQLQRESKVDHFVVRDRQGFHTSAASEWLNKHDADGWRKEHIDYQTLWIPAYGQNQSSYVETVMYVTFVRMVRVGA